MARKKKKTDYAIVVPSLNRPKNMKRLLSLFPDAYVTVNKSGIDIYRSVVPKKQLIEHPDMPLIETRNWILDNFQEECVLQFNDDVQKLVKFGNTTRTIRDPAMIKGVIINTMQCARDLGVGVFCWSVTANASMIFPQIRPFRANAPCSSHAFGVCGDARGRRFDPTFRARGDYDYTLETLLHDRLLLCDVRFSFDCGGMSRGGGGQSGTLTGQQIDNGERALRRKWGKCVGESGVKSVNKKKTWKSFSLNVQRTNPRAAT